MKKMMLFPLAAALLALASCQNAPISGRLDPYVKRGQVNMSDELLASQVLFQPAIIQWMPGGIAKVDVPVRNVTNDDITIEYRFVFRDRGAIVDGPSAWNRKELPRNSADALQFNSAHPVPSTIQGGDLEIDVRRFQ